MKDETTPLFTAKLGDLEPGEIIMWGLDGRDLWLVTDFSDEETDEICCVGLFCGSTMMLHEGCEVTVMYVPEAGRRNQREDDDAED